MPITLTRQHVLPLLSGLLLACSFPLPDLAPLAWFGLIPLLRVAPRHPFRSGFLCGMAFFAFVLYWLNIVMTTYGKLHPVLSVVAYLMLCLYLALYFGAATWASCRLREVRSIPLYLSLPVFWVGLEFLRSFLLTGFPWALLGYSQQRFLPLIQSADLFGVYGLSFLIVLINAVAAAVFDEKHRTSRLWRGTLAVSVLLFAANLLYGVGVLSSAPLSGGESIRVGLVQGNIPQDRKWDPEFQSETVAIYDRLSRQAALDGVDLLVWPESATPFYFQQPSELAERVRAVAKETGAHLLFGSPAFERHNREVRYLNSAFLLGTEGEVLGRSDKIHLVPFGEYVPLARFLPFVKKLVVGIGDFSPGTVSPLPLDGVSLGVLVCFESIFPELARSYALEGAKILVNITNDAWFGRSSAPWQHLVMSRFRAIETRTPVVRAANTGVSAVISAYGEIRAETDLFQSAYLVADIRPASDPSFYARHGDLLPLGCLMLGLLWLVQTRRHYRP